MRTTLPNDTSNWPEIWKAAYRIIEDTVVENQRTAWIDQLQFASIEQTPRGPVARFTTQQEFVIGWINEHVPHLKEAIEAAFTQVLGTHCAITIECNASSHTPMHSPSHPTLQSQNNNTNASPPITSLLSGNAHSHSNSSFGSPISPPVNNTQRAPVSPHQTGLDPKFTFDSFIVGNSNQFAHAAAVAVAENPGQRYNPLFLYSQPGLGKTHLLQAIGNHVLSRNPNARVVCLTAENFLNELLEALGQHKMPQFRKKYRDSYDMILLDDIGFIGGKKTTEEEFFHTFNSLHSARRQIVITSDRPPKELENLEARMRTRFECGLLADIQSPEIETRIAILKGKAEREDIYLPDDVATFIASYIKSSIRELEGVLVRLQAEASLSGAEITIDMAKTVLKAAAPDEGNQFTIETIQTAVSRHFQIKMQDFKSTTRSRSVAFPRQIAMYLARKYTGLGYKEIAAYFGGKDHTTIMHACQKIEGEFDSKMEVRHAVEAVQNLL